MCRQLLRFDKPPGIQRLLDMINFLTAHIPNMSTITAPLRCLLKSDVLLEWGAEQTIALTKVQEIYPLHQSYTTLTLWLLALYKLILANLYWEPASFSGGSQLHMPQEVFSPAECNYAQIEKELLAVVFACNKFHQHVYGFRTEVQSDRKPLKSIMLKPLHKVSPRLQLMLLKLQNYNL